MKLRFHRLRLVHRAGCEHKMDFRILSKNRDLRKAHTQPLTSRVYIRREVSSFNLHRASLEHPHKSQSSKSSTRTHRPIAFYFSTPNSTQPNQDNSPVAIINHASLHHRHRPQLPGQPCSPSLGVTSSRPSHNILHRRPSRRHRRPCRPRQRQTRRLRQRRR